MKINAIRALIITSLVIIILYTLGLFLPIIKNTKNSKTEYLFQQQTVFLIYKKITFL